MPHTRHSRTALVTAAASAFCLIAPASGSAATVRLDHGARPAQPLSAGVPTDTRDMVNTVYVSPAVSESYRIGAVVGPSGTQASPAAHSPQQCFSYAGTGVPFDYQGNGIYRATVTTYRGDNCAEPGSAAEYQVNVQARSSILSAPRGTLLTREPDNEMLTSYPFEIEPNPGLTSAVLAYGQNATVGADGALAGKVTEETGVLELGNKITARFETPGTYSLFAAAQIGKVRSSWSPPVRVRVKAPFDFTEIPTFAKDRGKRRVIAAQVRERAAVGRRVRVHVQRRAGRPPRKGPGQMGKPLGSWRSLGSAKVRKNGWFTKAYKPVTDNGYYELRFTMKSTDKIEGRSILGGGYTARPIRKSRGRN